MIKKVIPITLVLILLVLGTIQSSLAAGEHYPFADTFVDANDPDVNFGADDTNVLSASNLAGCVKTTWLFYKFHVPNTTSTLTTATLFMTLRPEGSSNPLPMELVPSSDITWDELTLTYDTRPTVGTPLAFSPSVPAGGTAQFSSAALGAYLNANKGSDVTLVVRADCTQTVAPGVNRGIYTKESAGGSGVYMIMYGPTPVELFGLKAESSTAPVLLLSLAGLVAMTGLFVTARRRK